MYRIEFTNEMKRNAKLMRKRGKDMAKLTTVLDLLSKGDPLPQQYRDHQLTGSLRDFRECHIEPDWLLVYEINNNVLVLMLYRLGSHSELFK